MNATSNHRRALPAALAALALAATGCATTNDPAQRTYVALGDSYASGFGAGDYDADDGCHRSAHAFPALVAEAIDEELEFEACSGAVVADVVEQQLDALDSAIDFVTITVGGNDSGLEAVLGACADTDTAACTAAIEEARALITEDLPGSLDGLYTQVEAQAGEATIIVVGYPRLFSETACEAVLDTTPDEQRAVNELFDLLADTIAAAATGHGFAFVDPRDAFDGHELCTEDTWVMGLESAEPFHPNATGYERYAELVLPHLN
ncbi:SGNH/GDSL hydrolase family protein [Glycomyces sp. NPDC046736]|uniref:SGNH/GDSL hydrolase family protein n=1 Tax=Glycomyces sp. NPDC046736 TaxID=3155615 RepID=UPI0033DA9F7E